jgi:Holliday junction DNA helicase RuvA
MIAALHGVLEGKTLSAALVRVGGVTFLVQAPLTTLSQLGGAGDEVTLHTHLYVREEVIALYGFATLEDLQLFETLLSVGGVGPRMGLAILSSMSAETFRHAVINGDEQRLTLIPGVGKKLAGRLILELREKLAKGAPAGAGVGAGAAIAFGSARAEVIEALTGLGYSTAAAQAAYNKLPAESASAGLEEQIMLVLRYLAKE